MNAETVWPWWLLLAAGSMESQVQTKILPDWNPEAVPPAMRERLKIPVSPFGVILPDGTLDSRNFIVSWHSDDNRQKIYTGFTLGLSSFTGNDITQCQIMSNGNLPKQSVVESVISSSLALDQQKIQIDKLKAHQNKHPRIFKPYTQLADKPSSELFETNGDEIVIPFKYRTTQPEVAATHVQVHNTK